VIPPSGEQSELVAGDHRAVVVEVGGGLRSYSVGGRALVDGYGVDEMCSSGRGQVLVPWPNRLEDGMYELDGRRHQLPLSEVEQRNAIHGLIRWSRFTLAERQSHRVVLEHRLHPQPGYPFTLDTRIEYAVSDAGLSVRTTATNTGAERCPYGAGAHPYLTLGTPTVDSLLLRAPARLVLQSDERGLPNGAAPVTGTPLDFRSERQIGDIQLDHAFTALYRDSGGIARVGLRDPASGAEVSLWVDQAYPYLMIFTGDPLPDVARRAIAVEPMTCPPNAFRSGTGLIMLEPGESFTGTWGIRPSA
jgi:aldose 1-epimerase